MTEIQISKWGNSSAIRLPKAVLDELGLKPGQSVQLTVKDGKGIIEPVRPKKITMEWILLGDGSISVRKTRRRRVELGTVTEARAMIIDDD